MEQWLKTLAGSMCVITILMHLLPDGKFTKYVRFYAGLLFFLIAVRPVMTLFTGEGEFERLLQLAFLREEYYDMETSVAGMEELKNDSIAEAYQEELRRQMQEMAQSYGITVCGIALRFDSEDVYSLEKIELTVEEIQEDGRGEALQSELCSLYALPRRDILITVRR